MGKEIRWHRVLGTLLLALFLTEGAAQLWVYVWAGEPYRTFSFYSWSPYGLVRNNPNLTSPAFQINEAGFRRDGEVAIEKPAKTLRVMLLGASVLYSGIAGNAFIESEGRTGSDGTIDAFLEGLIRSDLEFSDVDVEVINAAVNFNRIVEVSVSYIAEFAYYDPDIVIVFGSANNFGGWPAAGAVNERKQTLQSDHLWKSEFDRIVNRNDANSLVENTIRTLEGYFASVGLAKKVAGKLIDGGFALSRRLAPIKFWLTSDDSLPALANDAEVELLLSEYLGYVDAMAAVAKRREQHLVIFWENWLLDLEGVKQFSPGEMRLSAKLTNSRSPTSTKFRFHVRDRLAEQLPSLGISFVDPVNSMAVSQETLFIDYVHYTRKGNQLVAEVLFYQLRPVLKELAALLEAEPS
jgi:hypothetical protein